MFTAWRSEEPQAKIRAPPDPLWKFEVRSQKFENFTLHPSDFTLQSAWYILLVESSGFQPGVRRFDSLAFRLFSQNGSMVKRTSFLASNQKLLMRGSIPGPATDASKARRVRRELFSLVSAGEISRARGSELWPRDCAKFRPEDRRALVGKSKLREPLRKRRSFSRMVSSKRCEP